MRFGFVLIFILSFSTQTLAAPLCMLAGTHKYSISRLQVCLEDLSPWETVDGTVQAATCAPTEGGKQKFASNMMQYCDGANWRFMDTCGQTTTTCTGAGRQRFFNGAMMFCDGIYWVIYAGTCTASICTPILTSGFCSAQPECTWVGTCIDGV